MKNNADIESPVLFKHQGVEQPEDLNDFGVGDFAIGLQTVFQRDMLLKFGRLFVWIAPMEEMGTTFILLQFWL